MPSITYDGKSFMIDGRRIWIVAGSIHYARVPRAAWGDVIRWAKIAGLNTIETPVFWALHEPRPGQFDFEGELELRHFVRLVGDAGMHCILTPGPYVGADWTMGGLPGWLREQPTIQFRTNNQTFLEASGRYLSALASHLKGLQAAGPGASGPILLVQNESAWTCGDSDKGQAYLGEVHRYLREAGFAVPTISRNDLWQSVEGEVDCWSGGHRLMQAMRQLRRIRPDQPRLVLGVPAGMPACVGRPAPQPAEPALLQRTLAEALAAGAQFCMEPFHGGSNFAFRGGRITGPGGGFLTQTHDQHAPLSEAGLPGASFAMVRRIATFANHFARVFANLDADYHPVVLDPAGEGAGRERAGVSVVHASGPHGSLVFLFAGGADGRTPAPRGAIPLILPDGRSIEVSLGSQLAAWCIMDVQVGPRLRVDLCTFNALGFLGNVFACYGPSGSSGTVSVNGSPVELEAPRGKSPVVLEHEGVTLVIASEEQADAIMFGPDAVYLGASSLDAAGEPVGAPGIKNITRLNARGESSSVRGRSAPRGSKAPTMGPWEMASCSAYLDGTSPRYATIDAPGDLTSMGSAEGYGWYKAALRTTSAKKVKVRVPSAGDRLTFYVNGVPSGVIGRGPGAEGEIPLAIAKGRCDLVLLAENLGRASAGLELAERKGIFGPIYESKAVRVGKATVEEGAILSPLEHQSPLWGVHEDSTTIHKRVRWTFQHRKKTPIIVVLSPMPTLAMVLCNGVFHRMLEEGHEGSLVLDEGVLSRGNNTLEIALLDVFGDEAERDAAIASIHASFSEGVSDVTAKAEWAFAKWEPPARAAFESVTKSAMAGVKVPAWWRCDFEAPGGDAPLYLDAGGLTKGQIFINGRHLGRFWVSDGQGHVVGPQTRHFIPASWLNEQGANELMIFDELGGNPAKASLALDPHGRSTLA